MTTACRCGHPEAAHEHYRPGTDCGACGREACPHFRPAAARRRWAVRPGDVVTLLAAAAWYARVSAAAARARRRARRQLWSPDA
ncbi:hypothetical protein ACL02T_33045 [Pseudonocardia sp. RS010]|uniref:hypothetical protein n=1 Tax=Pseudonocardia sp. RS010 TaxID=3385979 RepID=UPI0039A2B17D